MMCFLASAVLTPPITAGMRDKKTLKSHARSPGPPLSISACGATDGALVEAVTFKRAIWVLDSKSLLPTIVNAVRMHTITTRAARAA